MSLEAALERYNRSAGFHLVCGGGGGKGVTGPSWIFLCPPPALKVVGIDVLGLRDDLPVYYLLAALTLFLAAPL